MNANQSSATSRPNSPSLSLVIPAYNEARTISDTVTAAWSYLSTRPYPSEIIVVDDGSSDLTRSLAEAVASSRDLVRVLSIPHGGKAAALRAGMAAATGDLVAFSDADLATPLTYLEPFRAAIEDGCDVVIGSREGAGARRIGEPAYRHIMGRAFNTLVRALLLPGIHDTQCGFKLFTRSAVNAILERSRLYATAGETVTGARVTAFDVELLMVARRQGFRISSIPVVWTYGSNSKVNPARDTWNNFLDVVRVKINDAQGRYR